MTTFTASQSTDLIALAPIVLGFVPSESLVMLTFGPQPSFHARIDLPDPGLPDEHDEVIGALLDPARVHGVPRVAFVLFTASAAHRVWLRRLITEFTDAGIGVVDAARFDADTWWCATCEGCDGADPRGERFVLADHPFVARAVFAGRVILGSRGQLADQVAPSIEEVERVAAAIAGLDLDDVALPSTEQLRRWIDDDVVPEPEVVAELIVTLRAPEARAVAWCARDRKEAGRHADWWAALTRRTPARWVLGPASMAAIAAANAGNGALAWCALERCLPDEADDPIVAFVASGLEAASPPATFAPADRRRYSA